MRRSTASILLLSALALVSATTPAHSNALVGWSGCTPVINEIEPYSAADHVLTVTIIGRGFVASSVDVTIGVFDRCTTDSPFIPQAWRFDVAGCQSGALRVERPESYGGCESLAPAPGTPVVEEITVAPYTEFLYPTNTPLTYPVLFIHLVQEFEPKLLVFNQHYGLARIHFDMTNTVEGVDPSGTACGCGGASRQLQVMSGLLSGPGGLGLIRAMNAVGWAAQRYCIYNGPQPPTTEASLAADPACMTTGALPRSWGALKAQYR